ncbi:MAG: competence/damage-inducible protein A [Bacteroidetes bacterium QS_9_68_14]|nr:MAG: competence/damage-inducible protein A [Bacteroidetes bacterium QS_9_68_14]
MQAHLLTIGDEILIGQTTDSNAAWLGEQLALMGADVTGAQTVRDTPAAIRRGLERGFEEADVVLTTGGLGPTHDDLTKTVVADFFGVELEQNADIMERIERYYFQTDRDVPEAVRSLAAVPAGFDLLENPVGTAPGLFYEETSAGSTGSDDSQGGRMVVVLPGVPQEMKRVMEASGLPRLRERGTGLGRVAHRTLQTTGIVESSLQEKVKDVASDLADGQSLAYLPSTSGVRLRLTARADADGDADRQDEAQRKLDALEERLRARIGKYVYGTGGDELEAVVGGLLAERGRTVALAESATGGLAAHRLTQTSGASAYFQGGIVAYANRAKTELLSVEPATLEAHGAVSEATARAMAEGARERFGASYGLSTTGVAGPTGGTDATPVGTVCVGCAAPGSGARAVRLRFTQDRQLNKELFSTALLETLRRDILGIEDVSFVRQADA